MLFHANRGPNAERNHIAHFTVTPYRSALEFFPLTSLCVVVVVVLVMVVVVVMSDDKAMSIILLFSAIKKVARWTDRPMDQETNKPSFRDLTEFFRCLLIS